MKEENPNLMIDISSDERIDDLQCRGYRIIQNSKMFCFGMDAVLLANFVNIKSGGMHMDLGTGTGVIPILMAAKEPESPEKTRVQKQDAGPRFIGLEIQTAAADMAARSVRLNDLTDKVRIDNGDIKEVSCNYGKASFDVVTSNPPYISGNHGLTNPEEPKNIARHEILVTLQDVIKAAAYLLKPGGSFCMVHKPFRLTEIFKLMQEEGLEPKRMQMVHPYIDKEPNMVLIECIKGANPHLKILPPMVVYKEPGVYTKQLLNTYEGERKS